jgi:hypothetical protein
MYTREMGLPEELAFNNMHTLVLLKRRTKFGFGLTEKYCKSRNLAMGGLDQDDVEGCKLIYIISKELQEEVGIDADDEKIASELKLKYLKYGFNGNCSIAAIFYLSSN